MCIKTFLRFLFLRLSGNSSFISKSMAITGEITLNECKLLNKLASQVKCGIIVEIGSYRGRSTIILALSSKKNDIPVYSIDPNTKQKHYSTIDKKYFLRNIFLWNLVNNIYLVNLTSEETVKGWNKKIGLLFIDGDHSYTSVKHDFEEWSPFVYDEGFIIFHDVGSREGPTKVVEFIKETKKYKIFDTADSIVVFRKIIEESKEIEVIP